MFCIKKRKQECISNFLDFDSRDWKMGVISPSFIFMILKIYETKKGLIHLCLIYQHIVVVKMVCDNLLMYSVIMHTKHFT